MLNENSSMLEKESYHKLHYVNFLASLGQKVALKLKLRHFTEFLVA